MHSPAPTKITRGVRRRRAQLARAERRLASHVRYQPTRHELRGRKKGKLGPHRYARTWLTSERPDVNATDFWKRPRIPRRLPKATKAAL